jgi:hypothetical protein
MEGFEDDGKKGEVRESFAKEIEVLARDFLYKWVALVGKTQHLYIHLLMHHLPDMIREFGDLRLYSSQGLEHCNKFRKRFLHSNTNHKVDIQNQRWTRVMQVLSGKLIADMVIPDYVKERKYVAAVHAAETAKKRKRQRQEDMKSTAASSRSTPQ